MKNFSHFMAATDFSASGQRAVDRAIGLATKHGATLDIVHALGGRLEAMLAHLGVSSRQQFDPQEARTLLDAEVSRADGVGVRATGHLYSGSPVSALDEAFDHRRPDLLVLGASDASDNDLRLLGTTSERLIRQGTPKTLICRLEPTVSYRRILASVALAPRSESVVCAASQLSESSEVVVFHAYSPLFERKVTSGYSTSLSSEASRGYSKAARVEANDKLQALLERVDVPQQRLTTVLRYGHAPQAILNAAFMQRCELVVIGRTKSAVGERLMGDVARHVLRDAPCDVMVIND